MAQEAQDTILSIQAAAKSLDDDDDTGCVRELSALLDQSSTLLVRSELFRQNIGNTTNPCIWPILSHLWNFIFLQTVSRQDCDHPALLDALCISIAKFTRNLVAGNSTNQQRAFDNESAIRHLIYHYTSYSATQDPSTYPITRIITQALSNIVTNNDHLAQRLWLTYLNVAEEQLILTRLFASPDPRTISSTFVLVINCIHDSVHRTHFLIEGPRGPRICLALLDRMASLFEEEAETESGRAFDIGYRIFSRVFETGLAAELYIRLAVEGEVITPHQITLLKLLDSYLHGSSNAHELALSKQHSGTHGGYLLNMLTHIFLNFSTYAQQSIHGALGLQTESTADAAQRRPGGHPTAATESTSTGSPHGLYGAAPLQEFDLLLPKVCEALVLATQCLTTIALRAEEAGRSHSMVSNSNDEGLLLLSPSPKTVMGTATSSKGQGLIECLVETLRLVGVFVPRITYGKVVRPPAAPGSHSPTDMFDTGTDTNASVERDPQAIQAAQAFAHVKRDLVRLLGILVSHDRGVQDRVRECGGIPVVMNLCVVDDCNPYLREHAIFTLSNLLHENRDNQAVVDTIQPIGRWDENRVLRGLRSESDGSS